MLPMQVPKMPQALQMLLALLEPLWSLRWLVSVPWNKAKCVRREDIILTTWEKLREKNNIVLPGLP